MSKNKPIEYIVDENGCFVCVSHRANIRGYSLIKIKGRSWLLHRYIYTIEKGEIPEGLVVRHTCDNPSCINPKHLLLGTHKDNTQDKLSRGRQAKGEMFSNRKLSEKEVLEILVSKDRQEDIATAYGVTQENISQIKTGKLWKHLKEQYPEVYENIKRDKQAIIINCLKCGKEFQKKGKKRFCGKQCSMFYLNQNHIRKTKIQWPDTKILIKMVEESNYVAVGKVLGVTDNAIRKRIKNHS